MTYWFAVEVGCLKDRKANVDHAVMKCLRNKSEKQLLDAYRNINRQVGDSFIPQWAPVVDGDLLMDSPAKILEDPTSESYKFFADLDFIGGANSADGSLYLFSGVREKAFGFNYTTGMATPVFENNLVRAWVNSFTNNIYMDITHIGSLPEAIFKMYSTNGQGVVKQAMQAIKFMTDLVFLIPTTRQINSHAQNEGNNSFLYYFDHMPLDSPYAPSRGYPSWFKGANHVEERQFEFGSYLGAGPASPEEFVLSDAMMTYVSNFAKSGNPNSPINVHVKWLPFTPKNNNYIHLAIPIRSEKNLLPDRVNFWTITAPKVLAKKTTSDALALGKNNLCMFISIVVMNVFLNVVGHLD